MILAIRTTAEAVGTGLLVAVVVGSGIMAQSLSQDLGISLLLNQLATILGLGVLIVVLMPLSGAHINPAVTLAFALRRDIPVRDAVAYGLAQLVGALGGVALAHLMFDRALFDIATNPRLTPGTFVSEVVATAGLIIVIVLLIDRGSKALIPLVVPAWIGAGYVFTASTAFANPAVTLGRMWTDSFTGIEPLSGLGFMGAQILGVGVALVALIPLVSPVREKV
jgi:glycerol uptake facilitator-like aquaporin